MNRKKLLDIGALVKEHRVAAQLTTRELAERAGTSQARVSEIENGHYVNGPSLHLLERLFRACGRTLEIVVK